MNKVGKKKKKRENGSWPSKLLSMEDGRVKGARVTRMNQNAKFRGFVKNNFYFSSRKVIFNP